MFFAFGTWISGCISLKNVEGEGKLEIEARNENDFVWEIKDANGSLLQFTERESSWRPI